MSVYESKVIIIEYKKKMYEYKYPNNQHYVQHAYFIICY